MRKLLFILLILLGVQTQAQFLPNVCDSVSYTVNTGSGTDLVLIGTVNIPGVSNIVYSWQACDANLCYSGNGQTSLFNQFSIIDTVKVCLIVSYCDTIGCYSCYLPCDTVVWNNGWGEPQPLGIYELQYTKYDNKIYDIYGREVYKQKQNIIYIKNGKKYILIK